MVTRVTPGYVSRLVAGNVRRERQARGWSAQRLADVSGIPRHTIAKLETSHRLVTVDELLVFAMALDVPVTRLIAP